ncbi:MAG TPA: RNase H family protein, partial [Oculatellaceae cyanobacterium]
DLTLLAPNAEELLKKWHIVEEFEVWTNMHVNKGKCEYDTTEMDEDKWAVIPGVKNVREDPNQDTLRVLGYLLNASGNRDDQLKNAEAGMRYTANMMRRKLMSPEIAKGVLNLIMTTKLQYIAQIHQIPSNIIKKMEKSCNQLAKAQFGLPNCTATASLYTNADTQLGLGLEHPGDVVNRTVVDEYVKALNSEKEAYTAEIMKANIKLVRKNSWRVKKICNLVHVTETTEHALHCRKHRQEHEQECVCQVKSYWDASYMQALRAAKTIGVEIENVQECERGIKGQSDRLHIRQANNESQVRKNDYVWLQSKLTNSEAYLGRVNCLKYEDGNAQTNHWTNDKPRSPTKIIVEWCPSVMHVTARTKEAIPIFGPNTAFEKSRVVLERSFITGTTVTQLYPKLAGYKREFTQRLNMQYKVGSETFDQHPDQMVGIGTWWECDLAEFHVHRVITLESNVRFSKRIEGRTRKFVVPVVEKIETEALPLDFQETLPSVALRQFERLLGDPAETGQVTIWTDGSTRKITETKKGRVTHTKSMGSGIRVEYNGRVFDLAAHICQGIAENTGAEMAFWYTVYAHLRGTKCVCVKTDSQAGMDGVARLIRNGYTDRQLQDNPARNILLKLRRVMKHHPEVIKQIKYDKVTSHTGVPGNEAADTLADMGAMQNDCVELSIPEGLAFRIREKDGAVIIGNVRRRLRAIQSAKHAKRYQACKVQGAAVTVFCGAHNNIKQGPRRRINSDKNTVRVVKSIQHQQHLWRQPREPENNKYVCFLCEKALSNASHKLMECIPVARHMALARLKYTWVQSSHSTEPPGWTKRIVSRRTEEAVQLLDEPEDTRVPMAILTKLAEQYEQSLNLPEGEHVAKMHVKEFERQMHKEISQAKAQKGHLEEAESHVHISEYYSSKPRMTPDFILRSLLQIGVYCELGEYPLSTTAWMMSHVVADSSRELGFGADQLDGGTFRNVTGNTDMAKRWSRHVHQHMRKTNDKFGICRHVALMDATEECKNAVTSNGGKILAQWQKNSFHQFQSAKDLLTVGGQARKERKPVMLVIWQTQGVKDAWCIPIRFWEDLLDGNKAATNGDMTIPAEWGITKDVISMLEKKESKPSHIGDGIWPTGYNTLMWNELQGIAYNHPYLFWAARLPRMKHESRHTPAESMESELTKLEVHTLHLYGKIVKKTKQIQLHKLDANQDLKSRMKENDKSKSHHRQQWYQQCEEDILNSVLRIVKLHSQLVKLKVAMKGTHDIRPQWATAVATDHTHENEGTDHMLDEAEEYIIDLMHNEPAVSEVSAEDEEDTTEDGIDPPASSQTHNTQRGANEPDNAEPLSTKTQPRKQTTRVPESGVPIAAADNTQHSTKRKSPCSVTHRTSQQQQQKRRKQATLYWVCEQRANKRNPEQNVVTSAQQDHTKHTQGNASRTHKRRRKSDNKQQREPKRVRGGAPKSIQASAIAK